MFRDKRNKEEHRYYLLPGMGRSNRHRHRQIFHWAILIGILASLVFAAALWYFNRHRL